MRLASLVVLGLLLAVVLVARTKWLEQKVARQLQSEVAKATGLRVTLASTSFSLWSFSVRVEGVELVRPGQPRLARVRAVEVSPSVGALVHGTVHLSRLVVDGADLNLLLRNHPTTGALELVNGPVTHASRGGGGSSELPFRDIAVSDLSVRASHPTLGRVELPSVDLDVLNAEDGRLMIGLLAAGGEVQSAQLTGPITRLEARLGYHPRTQVVRIALARAHVGRIDVRVHDATIDPKRETLALDAQLEAPVPDLLRFVPPDAQGRPQAPSFEGELALRVRANADLPGERFDVDATLDARGLALLARSSEGRPLRYALGDAVHARAHATREGVTVRDLRVSYAGAAIRSEQVTVGLRGSFPIAGRLSFTGLDFTRLMADTTVTNRTKVLWTLGGDIDVHGALNPLGLVCDLRDLDSREFAVLRDFFPVHPQRPVIHIPRARINGQMVVDEQSIGWRNMVATFGRSRVTVDRIRVRFSHDPRDPDLIMDNIHAVSVDLADLGHIADLPVRGEMIGTASARGDMDDPPLRGTARFNNFSLNNFPLGDFWTPAQGGSWTLRDIRVDAPVLEGRSGRSNFVLHGAYLDFRGAMSPRERALWRRATPANRSGSYTLAAGARLTSERFQLRDFYRMFHFTGDPTFEPFDGAGGTDVTIDWVMGRPGDDPDGVMAIDATLREWNLSAFGESLTHGAAHASSLWLRRRDGARGARTTLDYFRASKATGSLDVSGAMDLGGALHFVASVHGAPLSSMDLVRASSAPAAGLVNALATIEGTPDAPRITGRVTLQNLTTLGRNVGNVELHASHVPEGPPARQGERPSPGRIALEVRALDDALRVSATLRTPWEPFRWRDALGVDHPDYQRVWGHSVLSADVALTRPIDVLPWLPPSALARVGADARARLRARVQITRARLDELTRADGRAVVDAFEVESHGATFSLAPGSSLAACMQRGAYWLDVPGAPCDRPPPYLLGPPSLPGSVAPSSAPPVTPRPQILGPEGTRLWLAGGATAEGRYVVSTRGEFDLARIAPLAPGVSWGRGAGSFMATARGEEDRVALDGSLRMENAALGVEGLPSPVHDIDLVVRFQGSQAVLERARAAFGAGTVDLSTGFVRLGGTRIEQVDVPVVVRNLAVTPMDGADVALDADARFVWTADGDLPLLRGDVALTRARYTRPISLSFDLSGRLRGDRSAQPEAQYDPANDRLRLDLRLRSRAPIHVVNNLFDGELRIAEERPFQILGTNQRLGAVGRVDIPRGVIHLYNTDFDLRRGRIELENPERIAPTINIAAQTDIRRSSDNTGTQWRVRMDLHGPVDRLELDMTSEPALSREDIVLLLVFRLTRMELDRLGGLNFGQAVLIEVVSRAVGFDRVVRNLIPVDDVQFGSAYNPQTNRTEPQLSLGWLVGDRVRLGGSITTSERPLVRGTADLRVGGGASVQAVTENNTNQVGSQGNNVNVNFGVDLRWRLDFE